MDTLKYSLLLPLAFLVACGSGNSQHTELNFANNNGVITLPNGFQAMVVAEDVGAGRHITVAENGDIYMALRSPKDGNGIAALRDKNGDGKAEIVKYFSDLTGTGIQLHNGYLYFGSPTSIVRYKMSKNALIPAGSAETIISEFPKQPQHAAKSFTFDNAGNIYVNVGAPSNACQQQSRTAGSNGIDPCPQLKNHGGIWQFSASQRGQTFQEDGQRFATGIRNAVAIDWNKSINELYVVQHGRDQLHSLWPDYYTTEQNAVQPAEEFFRVNEGDNFGWPYTYYNWKKDQKMKAPEYGGDGEESAEKGKYENPIMAFPGHWAPNDLIFYDGSQFPANYHNGAFIAFHGSWNRAPEPQQGYKVVFVPFDGPTPSGDYTEFADGFAGQDSLQSPGNAQYRPMGIAEYKDGSLLISDSREGKIWRVVYTGK